MTRFALRGIGAGLLGVTMAATTAVGQRGDAPPARVTSAPASRASARSISPSPAHAVGALSVQGQRAVIVEYCLECHDSDKAKGGLVLETFDPARAEERVEISEKMIRKLRAGMMPPSTAEQPGAATVSALATALETRIDHAAAARPHPGRRTFQRLNRAEYARSIKDLFAIDVDVDAFLPPDTISHNFDNIADVQTLSPTLLEGYLRAASRVSRDAVGDPDAAPSSTTFKVPRTASQLDRVEGAPFGTRGGLSLVYNFPADGDYSFRMMLHSIPTGQLFGSTTRGEQLEISLEGQRLAVLDINPRMSESDPTGMSMQTPPLAIKAGARRVSAAFIKRWEGPVDDLLAPVEHTLADTQIGSAIGVTTLPHLRELAVVGPHKVTGVSDTVSRRRIFICRPLSASDEVPCASKIVAALGRQAYRRPLSADDLKGLMAFYDEGRKAGDFESGIRVALQALLASPHFLFRMEEVPAHARPGRNYRISDLDLASRLSFFLWAGPPDEELIQLASNGQLRAAGVLDKQVRRMLADRRAAALAQRFAGQWLRLQDLEKIHPDPLLYPQYDRTLAAAMQRETELLFESIVAEDRSVLELVTADYTYVNERLARHYGIPNVSGSAFRRVPLPDPNRRGLLGHGSVLAMTSVADRTSPVLRGKWVLEVLFGSPPPPPPPDVPDLDETKSAQHARLLSVRERMEQHRANPTCRSCHRVIDPIGLALENFDVTGAWRIRDNGVPVDASGELYDGTRLNGPIELRQALLARSEIVLRTFTENLMTYGLGRRVEPQDMPAVRAIVRGARSANYGFSSFVAGIVNSPAFQMSRAEMKTE